MGRRNPPHQRPAGGDTVGRQPKIGLDYFLFNVDLLNDPKLRRPRQEFGYLSEVIYIALLCILYRDKGYYIDYRGKKQDDVIWQVSEQINGKYTATAETIANVITCLAECELFSGELLQVGIITSARAQKAYYSATSDRKNVSVNFDWWLLSKQDMESLSTKSFVLQSYISQVENGVSRAGNAIYRAESTQSREEQSREEKSRSEKMRAEDSRAEQPDLSGLSDEIEKLVGATIDQGFRKELNRLALQGMAREVLLRAAAYTGGKQAKDPPAYLRRVLQSYERDGIRTIADLEALHPAKPRNAAPACKQPTGELDEWERQHIETVKAHLKGRRKEPKNEDRQAR